MDDIPTQPPVVVQAPVNPEVPKEEHSPLNVEYEQPKTWFGRVFDYSSWFVLFFLAPFTVAIFLSQNSIPGDLMYPIKLGLENLVLTGASLHPSTRAMFHTNVSGRRFAEAEALLLTRADITGLQTFIKQVEEAQIAVNNVSDPVEKERLQEELVAKIIEYETKLVTVEAQAQENVALAVVPQTQTAPQTQTQQQQNQTQEIPQSTVIPTPSYTPTPSPTATPTPTPKTSTGTSSVVVKTPTPTPIPTHTPTPTSTPQVVQPAPVPQHGVEEKKKEIVDAINNTQQDLDRIKKEIEEKKQKEREERMLEKLQKEEEKRQKQEEKQQERQEQREKREDSSGKKGNNQDND